MKIICKKCQCEMIWQMDSEDIEENTYSEYYCEKCEDIHISYWEM